VACRGGLPSTGLVIMCVDGNADTTLTSFARIFLKCSKSNMSPNSLQIKAIKNITNIVKKIKKN
jgi:hypothetical protein